MRRVILCLLILLPAGLSAQIFPSSCNANAAIEKIYRNDAYKIATDRVRKLNLNWKDSIDIPEIYVDTVARAFYAIDNMAWSKLKDTIRTLFGYSDFNSPGPQSDSSHIFSCNTFSGCNVSCKTIVVSVSSTANWYNAWQSGSYDNTPNAEVNSLMAEYSISVTPWIDFSSSFRIFYLKTSRAVNSYALAAAFMDISGTVDAHADNTVGDGNSINVQYATDGLKLTFRAGCGDCPVGCTYGRYWEFKYMFADCSVEYLTASNFGGTIDQFLYGAPYTCTNFVMPVAMSPLLIRLVNKKPQLQWQIFTQANISEYIVERSVNGTTFVRIATILASTETLPITYKWTDDQAKSGHLFYRIKAVGSNGEFRYSNTADIKLNFLEDDFNIVTNPVIGKKLDIRLNSMQQQNGRLTIFNYSGQKIYSIRLRLVQGINDLDLQLPPTVLPGYYVVSLTTNNIVLNKQVIIK